MTEPVWEDPDELCWVCEEEPVAGVAAMPGVPVSGGYCIPCIKANAHPYRLVVGNTAVLCGEPTDWWADLVFGTLMRLKKTSDEFWDDVEEARRLMSRMVIDDAPGVTATEEPG